MRRFFRNNGLSLVFTALFLLSLFVGQLWTGYRVHNEDALEHGWQAMSLLSYLGSGAFLEATMENWESEFLQMFAFVFLSGYLFQKGSAESRDPDKPRGGGPAGPDSPWPVRRGGWPLALYRHSLSLAFLLCFLATFALHALGGAREYNQEALQHGGEVLSVAGFLGTSQFWFESFQNWQSEFLSVAAVALLSIVLREKGSSQSKEVEDPHSKTGTD